MRFPSSRPSIVLVVSILSVTLMGGCTTTRLPLTNLKVPVPIVPLLFSPIVNDFSGKSWPDAFDRLHGKLALEYPFTEWKAINWDELHATYAPIIKEATANDDRRAFQGALRQYLFSLRDGYVDIATAYRARQEAVGGGFGFSVIELSDGRFLAHLLEEGGPATEAGMQWGAELHSWNGQPVAEALDAVETYWAPLPSPTNAAKRLEQVRYLTRAPVDTGVEISFTNPDSETPRVCKLTAKDDRFHMLDASIHYVEEEGEFSMPVKSEILEGNVGYVRISFFGMSLATPFPAQSLENALIGFLKNDCPGLILDLRGNPGGVEEMPAEFAGFFTQEKLFYRSASVYNKKTKTHEIDAALELNIVPRSPYYDKPVLVLVDNYTMKAAEGLAAALQRLPQARVMGVNATHGSFGITGGTATMPGSFTLHYPIGKNVGEGGNAIIEANAAGEGGVHPDIRVPITKDLVEFEFVRGGDPVRQMAADLLLGKTDVQTITGG